METKDRAALVGELGETRATFLEAFRGVSEAQGKFRPAPDRWSIEECAEHVALVEKGLLMRVADESAVSDRSDRPERQQEVRQFVLTRVPPRQAPERFVPTGRFGSLAKALEQFAANRDQTIDYVRACKDDLHARSIAHPIGQITCHEGFVMIAQHPIRHLSQILEIQAMPGYPNA